MPELVIGSERHKELFCREFIDTHLPYDVAALRWPVLDEASLARLCALPFWQEAVSTESATAAKVQAQARLERDALMHEAVALQGYEEERHSQLLQSLLTHYDIGVSLPPSPPLPTDIEWAFLRTEYGECFDSFFAFGLFAIAKDSGFFPAELVTRFEPIMQEEARHILFFVNWLAYRRAQLPWWQRPALAGRCLLGMTLQVWSRIQTARGVGDGDFTLKGHESIDTDLSPRDFLHLCLQENERRLKRYDPYLLRPQLVPTLAKAVCRVLPKRRGVD
ncbi:MAG: ferritin-like domain-containing protein [Deltaproteobacteria bacterium]|nr:ferritin-like domain-containing protein [Deltaproteobacteria bacterium]